MLRKWLICFLMAVAVVSVYWPVRYYDFVCSDDPGFITENAAIRNGLSWASLRYALTSAVVGNWHPVTTLSHILDCQFFGVNPGPMHLVNAAIHAISAVLLFLLLQRLTGFFWRSALVAALFALHPLRVESVAWISERKDVLSAFFFFLTLLAYHKYVSSKDEGGDLKLERASKVQSPKSKVQGHDGEVRGPKSEFRSHVSGFIISPRFWYVLALVFFALGLVSKPMLVTLPFVLLLLDFWPLNRLQVSGFKFQPPVKFQPSVRFLFLEKLPFFILSGAACVVTFLVQRGAGAMGLMSRMSFDERVTNALVGYVRYLGKLFWPTGLAAVYPHPGNHYYLVDHWSAGQVWAAGLLLLAITTLCLVELRRRPWLGVGWFWYLGMMIPVIGLIQVGDQAIADRYTYLPMIGLVLSMVWLVAELFGVDAPVRPPNGGQPPARSRAERYTDGRLRTMRWRIVFLAALSILTLTVCALLTRRQAAYWENTVKLFERTVEITPDNPSSHLALGAGLEKDGDTARAMVEYRVAVAIAPHYTEAHYNLGQILRKQGRWQEAAAEYMAALRGNPNHLDSHLNLAGVLLQLGRPAEAIGQFEEALRLAPDSIEALNNLAWVLAASAQPSIRNGPRAVELGERACQLTRYQQTIFIGTLAAAYAEAGQFDKAIATGEMACDMARRSNDSLALGRNQKLLELYREGKAYHEGEEE